MRLQLALIGAGLVAVLVQPTQVFAHPTIGFKAPADGSTVSGVVEGSDCETWASSDTTSVAFYLDGRKINYYNVFAPWNCSFDSSTLSEGWHTLRAVAGDGQGHYTDTAVQINVAKSDAPSGASLVAGEPARGTVIASSNFEDQTVGDMNIVQCYPGDLSFTFGGAAQGDRLGTYMVREGFKEPHTGSERCESVRGAIPSQQAYLTRAWMRVPSSSQFNEWVTTIQWKTTVESGPPPLDLFLLPAKYRGGEHLSLRSGDSSTIAWNSPAIQRDKWYRVVVKTYLHSDPTKGYEEVWFGDASGVTRQVMTNGAGRFYMKNAVPASTHHFRFGIRRASANTGTTVVGYDDLSIERTSP